jgi:hypothetical protein
MRTLRSSTGFKDRIQGVEDSSKWIKPLNSWLLKSFCNRMGEESHIKNVFLLTKHLNLIYEKSMSGRNSGVECYLAKVDVDGSNPFARSIYLAA